MGFRRLPDRPGIAASGFGLPDIGLVGMAEMADRAAMATRVLREIPLIADADTGYGPPMSVARTVRAYEQAGVAAIQLEDQAFPKRCGHLPGKVLVSPEESLARLGAALEARTDALIIARTDARAVLGLDAAIERGNAYAAAGADVICVEAPGTVEEMALIAREISAPKLINIVAGGLPRRSSRPPCTTSGTRSRSTRRRHCSPPRTRRSAPSVASAPRRCRPR